MPEHQKMQQSGKPDSTFQKQAALTTQTQVSHPASIIQRARINPKSLTAADVLQLQRTIGNRAVGRLLSEIRNPSKVQQVPIQRQPIPEEEKETLQGMFGKKPEETCPSCVQRQEKPEEEEPLQGKFETIQRLEPEEKEKLQMKSVVQRQETPEDEEPLQDKMAEPVQRQEIPEEEELIQGKMIGTVQRQEIPEEEEPLQKKSENNTGMPDNLKAGVENLSGIDMSDVRVHYNSDKPAEVGALAYTQGTNIHVAPGQERHLPHEAWHVMQQVQGRVQPTMQVKEGVMVNDDAGLEHEADMMGTKALKMKNNADLFITQKKLQSVITAISKIAVQKQSVIQRNHTNVQVPYKSDEQLEEPDKDAIWAISNDLNVTIGQHVSSPPNIHNERMVASDGSQLLKGEVTAVIVREGQLVDTRYPIRRTFHPTAESHTEGAFMQLAQRKITEIVEVIGQDNIRGIIIEIRQTNTPCVACQQLLSREVEQIRTTVTFPVIIRASAERLYEQSRGELGNALANQQREENLQDGSPDIGQERLFGVHKLLPPLLVREEGGTTKFGRRTYRDFPKDMVRPRKAPSAPKDAKHPPKRQRK
jgi:hypothetical protein